MGCITNDASENTLFSFIVEMMYICGLTGYEMLSYDSFDEIQEAEGNLEVIACRGSSS